MKIKKIFSYKLITVFILIILIFIGIVMFIFKANYQSPQQQTENDKWKKVLTPMQYYVLRKKGTEKPFTGDLLHEQRKGTYVTADCGEPVFRSEQKFDSGTGWPSFWAPIASDSVELVEDNSFGIKRIEVVGKKCKGHLGHVFDDGPEPTGKRYCINSVALKFIPDEN